MTSVEILEAIRGGLAAVRVLAALARDHSEVTDEELEELRFRHAAILDEIDAIVPVPAPPE